MGYEIYRDDGKLITRAGSIAGSATSPEDALEKWLAKPAVTYGEGEYIVFNGASQIPTLHKLKAREERTVRLVVD